MVHNGSVVNSVILKALGFCAFIICVGYNASYIGAKFPLVKILSILNDLFFSISFSISRIG